MTSVLRFSDSFWDEQDRGIDILTEKLASSEQTCRDLRNIYEIRAQIEKEYGQRLLELSHYALGEVELGTLAASIQRIPKAFESTGKAHIDMAEQLQTSLEAPLESFLKEQSEIINARTHQIENSKKLKDMHLAHVEKAKQAYDEANQVLKQKEQNGEDTESSKYSLAMADREWKCAVENLQEVTNKFILDWRITCDLYQDLEERRINFIRSNLWAFANMMSSVFIIDDRGCEGIRTGLEMTDVRKDINDFILKYGTSVKVTDGSHQFEQNEIVKTSPTSDGNNNDTMANAFQEVEYLLSDTASNERHSVISTSSMDQRSVYSNSSNNNNNNNRSSLASIHSPLEENNNKIKENTTAIVEPFHQPSIVTDSWANRSQSPSPPLPTIKKVLTPTKQSPLKGTENINNDSSDDDDDKSKLPIRASKPREEKWTISTRKNKTASMITPPKNDNELTSKRNSFVTKQSLASSTSLPSLPPRKSYLNPSVHPPPLKQSPPQQNFGIVSSTSQTTILYPPQETNHTAFGNTTTTTTTTNIAISNNTSPVYFIASSSTNSLILDNNNNNNGMDSQPTNQKVNVNHYSNISSTQVCPPLNQPVNNYQPSNNCPSSSQPFTSHQFATNYQHVPSYRPIIPSTSPNHQHNDVHFTTSQPTTATNHSATDKKNTANQQEIQPSNNNHLSINQSITDYSQTNHHHQHHATTNPPPPKKEQEQMNIGIRPPKWENRQNHQQQAEIDNHAGSDYIRGDEDLIPSSSLSSPAKSGLQRYNSVNGPRDPPSKGNFINSSELKNTHGVGEETVAILKEEQEASSIQDITTTVATDSNNNNNNNNNNNKPISTSTQPTSSKSGFSFNNIFFKKDKPAVVDDDKRILGDGTAYKHKARAIWSYEAKIPSELTFQANDIVAVIRKQPDGWWEAEILDEQRRQRGLVPGNFFSLN